MDIVQIIGALLVLAAFAAVQFGRWRPENTAYLAVNVVGAGILAVVAAVGGDPGFLLLEGVWALVSAWSLVQRVRGRPVAGAH